MTVELTRVYHFSAAHQLGNPALSAEDNAALYGACAGVHGHNYYLEVTVGGKPDRVTGMVLDLGELDEIVQRRLLDQIDHHSLEAAPVLAAFDATGRLRYVGGYYAHPSTVSPLDEKIYAQLATAASPEPLPVFGCAVSARLQKSVDPLGIVYSSPVGLR